MSDGAYSVNAIPSENGTGALQLASRAARDGATDASEAAAPVLGEFEPDGLALLYNTAYTLSYGVVFPSHTWPGRSPATMRSRAVEGAEAATRKVDGLLNRH